MAETGQSRSSDASTASGGWKAIFGPVCFGLLVTPPVAFVVCEIVTAIVPHHQEGIRDVISVSWWTYVGLCLAFPIPVVHVLSRFAFRTARERIVSLVTAFFVFLAIWPMLEGTLDRAYIGK